VYEFDASVIPAEGYDAQCTHCNAIFFVAPEAPAAAQVSVSCTHCGAVYQFAAADVPPGGYDAQCTQCQGVFFVSADGAGPPAMPPVEPEFVQPTLPAMSTAGYMQSVAQTTTADIVPELGQEDFKSMSEVMGAAPQPPRRGFSPEALGQGTMELQVGADSEVTLPRHPRGGPDVGKPYREEGLSSTGGGADLDEELAPASNNRTWLYTALGAVVLVGVVGVLYTLGSRTHEAVGEAKLRAPRPANPAAVPAFDRGYKSLLDDTDAGYTAAIAAFNEALATDNEYADALASSAIAHTLEGADWIAQGQAHLKGAHVPADERRALQAAKVAGGKGAKEAAARLAELEQAAATRKQEAQDALEKGGKLMSDGQVLLLKARRLGVESPLIAEAQAIWYTTDPEGATRAQEQLTHAVQLRQGSQATLSLTDPPDAWSPFIQARVWASGAGNTARASEAYRATLKREPKLQRARWELAALFAQEGQRDDAIKLLEELVAAVPKHEKAERLLASLRHPEEKVVAAAEPPTPKAEPAAKHPAKGKRHRGKRK
jgi:predicted Zn finger-like uncharacterized protein